MENSRNLSGNDMHSLYVLLDHLGKAGVPVPFLGTGRQNGAMVGPLESPEHS